MKRFFLLFFLFVPAFVRPETDIGLNFGFGWDRVRYMDRTIVGEEYFRRFPVKMYNGGFEFVKTEDDGYISGFGSQQLNIEEGVLRDGWNTVERPEIYISTYSFFIGKEWGIWRADFGFSLYLTANELRSRYRYDAEGNSVSMGDGGMRIIPEKTVIMPNFYVRLGRESWYAHLRLCLARGFYNPLSSPLNMALVFPFLNNVIEINWSYPLSSYSLIDFLNAYEHIDSDQVIGLSYIREGIFESWYIGININYLLKQETAENEDWNIQDSGYIKPENPVSPGDSSWYHKMSYMLIAGIKF